ncbi:hypothetical protein PPOLYM_01930 [Paenibacillus polymyxa]|nr:hypothetical protein PPOLYM_01930 [Paenibacillus polymyxa]
MMGDITLSDGVISQAFLFSYAIGRTSYFTYL